MDEDELKRRITIAVIAVILASFALGLGEEEAVDAAEEAGEDTVIL
mgnify:CR=1 FL=1